MLTNLYILGQDISFHPDHTVVAATVTEGEAHQWRDDWIASFMDIKWFPKDRTRASGGAEGLKGVLL